MIYINRIIPWNHIVILSGAGTRSACGLSGGSGRFSSYSSRSPRQWSISSHRCRSRSPCPRWWSLHWKWWSLHWKWWILHWKSWIFAQVPRGAPATASFTYLQDKFGAGNAFPYMLVVEAASGPRTHGPPTPGNVLTERFFVVSLIYEWRFMPWKIMIWKLKSVDSPLEKWFWGD